MSFFKMQTFGFEVHILSTPVGTYSITYAPTKFQNNWCDRLGCWSLSQCSHTYTHTHTNISVYYYRLLYCHKSLSVSIEVSINSFSFIAQGSSRRDGVRLQWLTADLTDLIESLSASSLAIGCCRCSLLALISSSLLLFSVLFRWLRSMNGWWYERFIHVWHFGPDSSVAVYTE